MFIRVQLENTNHEWGWNCDFVPAVGDELWLYVEQPDQEWTGDHHLVVNVVNRIIPLEEEGTPEIWVIVRCDAQSELQSVPDGYIPHSPEWPSAEYTARQRRTALACQRILAGLPPED